MKAKYRIWNIVGADGISRTLRERGTEFIPSMDHHESGTVRKLRNILSEYPSAETGIDFVEYVTADGEKLISYSFTYATGSNN